jgi:hypothetical protein
MKKLLMMLFVVVSVASCTVQKPLYSWYNYNATSYSYLKNADEASTQQLLESYQKIIEKQKGSRATVPPGVYADYGFLLLKLNKTTEGKSMLAKEMEIYPESKVFIERILKMLEK